MSFESAQAELFAHYGLPFTERRVGGLHFVETGEGDPLLFVHGSGMSAATWAPLMAELRGRRCIAVDLPGFGLSAPHDYVRPLREEAVAQMTAILDALELGSAHVVGTSLGGMWGLCLALQRPERIRSLVVIGMPAVALPGVRPDPYFRLMTTPIVRALVARAPAPPNARRGMKGVLGQAAIDATPDEWFRVVTEGMRAPGYRRAMSTHLNLALRGGKARPGIALSDEELGTIDAPSTFVWGDRDRYGSPDIGERAVSVMPDAALVVVAGNHAPFLDDPRGVATVIDNHVGRVE